MIIVRFNYDETKENAYSTSHLNGNFSNGRRVTLGYGSTDTGGKISYEEVLEGLIQMLGYSGRKGMNITGTLVQFAENGYSPEVQQRITSAVESLVATVNLEKKIVQEFQEKGKGFLPSPYPDLEE